MKACTKCYAVKPLEEFNRAASTKDGRRGECKKCAAWISQLWREQNSERWNRSYRARIYGLSWEAYEALLAAQGGVCAICKGPEPIRATLSVDHDHRCCPPRKSCGRCIRGLLCTPCNRALAALRDDPTIVEAAANYLRRFRLPGYDAAPWGWDKDDDKEKVKHA